MTILAEAALTVLCAAEPAEKLTLTARAGDAWQSGGMTGVGRVCPPDRPARPTRPPLLPPNRMPKRRLGGEGGKVAMLHALAHIEFNAIDLAWDIIARFSCDDLPRAFFDDWVGVAVEEARHFAGLAGLLADLGAEYGALPAHDGLWEAAIKTADDLATRLAVVPMTLEARALDTAPATIERLRAAGDAATVAVLDTILADEISHVAVGVRWFDVICRQRGKAPAETYQAIIRQHFPKGLKAPFNSEARSQAGFPPDYYEPLATGTAGVPASGKI